MQKHTKLLNDDGRQQTAGRTGAENLQKFILELQLLLDSLSNSISC